MTGHKPRFEIARTDAGWHVRFRAANSRVVVSSENYTRREGALKAIKALQAAVNADTEVRDVDEREVGEA